MHIVICINAVVYLAVIACYADDPPQWVRHSIIPSYTNSRWRARAPSGWCPTPQQLAALMLYAAPADWAFHHISVVVSCSVQRCWFGAAPGLPIRSEPPILHWHCRACRWLPQQVQMVIGCKGSLHLPPKTRLTVV